MKIWMKIITFVTLSFFVSVLSIGYASISGSLEITGTAEYQYIYPVYIDSIAQGGTSSNTNSYTINSYEGCFLNTNITLSKKSIFNTPYIILAVTVKNQTIRDYAYDSTTGLEDVRNLTIGVYSDASCSRELRNDVAGTVRGKNSDGSENSLTFYVKFSHTQNSAKSYNNVALKFNFTTEVTNEEVEEVTKTLSAKFLEILNDAEDYERLTTAMDDNYDPSTPDKKWKASFIGNVQGAEAIGEQEDSELIEELFGGTLSIPINGATVNVTCIIKREDLDNNASTGDDYTVTGTEYKGCEMTLYLTAADLSALGYNSYPTVYAMVFTRSSAESDWYQIGEELYEGTAQVVGYMGGEKPGSFDTGQWRSSLSYHGLTSKKTIGELIRKALSL